MREAVSRGVLTCDATQTEKKKNARFSTVCGARQVRRGRTEADDVVVARAAMYDVPRPRVVLDPPNEPLRAALDLTDAFLACYGAPGELILSVEGRVQHDRDFAQPARQLGLDAADESLRARARAPERLAHAAQREAKLPRAARLGIRCGWSASGEWCTALEIRREGDGERGLEDG